MSAGKLRPMTNQTSSLDVRPTPEWYELDRKFDRSPKKKPTRKIDVLDKKVQLLPPLYKANQSPKLTS